MRILLAIALVLPLCEGQQIIVAKKKAVGPATTARDFGGTGMVYETVRSYLPYANVFTVAFWFRSNDTNPTVGHNYQKYALTLNDTAAVIYGFVDDGAGHAQIENYFAGSDSRTLGYWLLGSGLPETESSPSPNTTSLAETGTTAVVDGPLC